MMELAKRRLRWLTARPIAHRGLHDRARGRPENSLLAFEAATDSRYAIECDLHISADGVPVVFHDDDLGRLTGELGCVRDRSAADMRRLTLLGTREHIPTLDELLELVGGRVPLVIELKHIPGRDAGFARSVVDRLKRYDGAAALMSFNPALIADVKAVAPQMPRGYIAEGGWREGRKHIGAIRGLAVDFISYRIDDLPTPVPIFANRVLRIPLICWTVRNAEQMKRAETWTDQITFEGFAA